MSGERAVRVLIVDDEPLARARLEDLVRAADVVLLVVPPGAARAAGDTLAAACEATGARPLTVEMDAVSPDTVRAVAEQLPGDLVDGAISGPPPRPDAPTPTRVFLSGPRAGDVAALGAPGVRWIVLDGPVEHLGYRLGHHPVLAVFVAGELAYVRPEAEHRVRR